jgi:subtilisin-like proprotein convertase family protein
MECGDMKRRHLRRIVVFLALASLAAPQGTGVFASLFAGAARRPAAQDKTKEEMTARLNELNDLIQGLKQRRKLSRNARLRAELESAIAEYKALSESMGGDQASPRVTSSQNKKSKRAKFAPQVAPGAPAGCITTLSSFTQSTPTAIPSGPATVTSTVSVTTTDTFIWDVDLTTNLTHTFAADLDITLMSPAGTIVTLTTDNGAGNDNVFNGTLWDDDANPAGQVPYTTNNGLVTDHAYANLTLASPLAPEEPLGAFIGENPNGTWTITISDDLAGDSGSLDSWTLNVTTVDTVPTDTTASFTQSTPTAIPDGPAVVSSTVAVAAVGAFLRDVNITANITHTFCGDLDITLMSPAGTVVTLTTDNTEDADVDNVFNGTLWDDDANPGGQVPYSSNNGVTTDHSYVNLVTATPLTPEEPLAAFIGENPNGTWTITISDDTAIDGGSLDSWTLQITTGTCGAPCMLTCPANITQSNDPNQCGAVVNYSPPTTSGTCGTVTCSPPSGSFFPVGTTTVTCSEDSMAMATCSFTVTVNDTQPPSITCPANVTAVGTPGSTTVTVTFPDPTFSDNCPGATVACVPPSGSMFPVGTSTVTCTATDASGNTASCSFTVQAFDGRLQDNSAGCAKTVVFDTISGAYSFCCNGMVKTGIAKVTKKGLSVTLEHNAPDRRVLIKLDGAVGKGTATLQMPPGVTVCTITDSSTANDTCTCP